MHQDLKRTFALFKNTLRMTLQVMTFMTIYCGLEFHSGKFSVGTSENSLVVNMYQNFQLHTYEITV